MNRGERGAGFTIVETLIFLAASSAIFLIAMASINGQQNKSMFVNAVRDFETKLTDVANDLSTGYFSSGQDFRCIATGSSGIVINPGTPNNRGDCVFLGTVMKFGNGSDRSALIQFTMLGLRTEDGTTDVQSLGEAKPEAVDTPNSIISFSLLNGTTIECVMIDGASCIASGTNNGAIGFFNVYNSVGGRQQAGGVTAELASFRTVTLTDDTSNTADKISSSGPSGLDYSNPGSALTFKPDAVICLKSGTTDQYALVRIGSSTASKLTFSSEIKNYSGADLCT